MGFVELPFRKSQWLPKKSLLAKKSCAVNDKMTFWREKKILKYFPDFSRYTWLIVGKFQWSPSSKILDPPKSTGNHPFHEIQNKSFRHNKNWFWFIISWLLVISHILFIECFIVLKLVQALYFQQYLFLVSDYHLMMLPAETGYFVFLIIYLTTLWKFGIFKNVLDIHLRPYLLLLTVLKM